MNDTYETDIGALLGELAEVQTALLGVLTEKRELLVARDEAGLAALAGREEELAARLQACHERRQELLARADADGFPADSIHSLSNRLPAADRDRLQASIREVESRTKLLQHQSLANWVLVQRSL